MLLVSSGTLLLRGSVHEKEDSAECLPATKESLIMDDSWPADAGSLARSPFHHLRPETDRGGNLSPDDDITSPAGVPWTRPMGASCCSDRRFDLFSMHIHPVALRAKPVCQPCEPGPLPFAFARGTAQMGVVLGHRSQRRNLAL